MAIFLSKIDNIFTLEENSVVVLLSATSNYINYIVAASDNVAIISTLFPPAEENDLFIYTSETVELDGYTTVSDVYNFKNNTILYSGNSTGIAGLFQIATSQDRDIMFKNLKILVTDVNYSVEGYMLANLEGDNLSINFVENCHVLFDLPSDTPTFNVNGLIGTFFGNGVITKCSFNSVEGGKKAAIAVSSGGICKSAARVFSAVTQITFISYCWSDSFFLNDDAGGICGASSGASNGGTSNLEIYACYSTGRIAGDNAGGICGSSAGEVFNVGSTSNLIIRECYSTGSIATLTGEDGGGICGARCGSSNSDGSFATVVISSCYSTGVITDNAGGICGVNCALETSASASSTVTISCSYALGGVVPNSDFAEGTLVGAGSTVANIDTTTNNSFQFIMTGGGDGTGRVTLTTLTVGCSVDYSATPRCVFDGGFAPILEIFLVCDNWSAKDGGVDESCLELFAPQIGLCDGCPIDWTEGTGGVYLTWQETNVGGSIKTDCEYVLPCEQEYYKRTCLSSNTWGAVNTFGCGDNNGGGGCDISVEAYKKKEAEVISIGCILGVLLVLIVVAIIIYNIRGKFGFSE